MRLGLNPGKLVMLAWPIYVLSAIGAALQPQQWRRFDVFEVLLLSSPAWIFALGLLARERWWLELTPEALVHHTLTRAERFEWSRMGAVELRLQHVGHLPLWRTLWFPFPTDEPRGWSERITKRIGRRLLLVFGDRSARQTVDLLEAWREGRRLG